jgi:hypothetical protein
MEDDKLLPMPEWDEYLTAFCKMVERDLPSTLLQKPRNNLFAKRGEWILRFSEKEILLSGNLMGLPLIRHLMQTPHEEIHVERLWNEVFGRQGAGVQSEAEEEWDSALASGEEVLDTQGMAAIKDRLLQLSRDRIEAETENDSAWLGQIDQETELITKELQKNFDGKGKVRKIGDERDRLRKRISKNITKTVELIEGGHWGLAEHLRNSLQFGEFMAYRPTNSIQWSFE